MDKIIIKVRILGKFEKLKNKIEKLMNREVKEFTEKFEVLNRAKGCLKNERTWQELEAELFIVLSS